MSLPSFGARRPVPANLLMMALILGGIYAGLSMRREFFPEIDPEAARVELVPAGTTFEAARAAAGPLRQARAPPAPPHTPRGGRHHWRAPGACS